MALPIISLGPDNHDKKYTININCKEQRVRKELELDIKFADSNFNEKYYISEIRLQGEDFWKSNFFVTPNPDVCAITVDFVEENGTKNIEYLYFNNHYNELKLYSGLYKKSGIYQPNDEVFKATYHFDEDEIQTLYQSDILTLKFSDTEKVSLVFNNGNKLKDIFERLA